MHLRVMWGDGVLSTSYDWCCSNIKFTIIRKLQNCLVLTEISTDWLVICFFLCLIKAINVYISSDDGECTHINDDCRDLKCCHEVKHANHMPMTTSGQIKSWPDYKLNVNIKLWNFCETLIVYILLSTFQLVHMVLTVNKPAVRRVIAWIESADWNPSSLWTFVGLCAAFWSIFLRKKSSQITHANQMTMTTSGQILSWPYYCQTIENVNIKLLDLCLFSYYSVHTRANKPIY